MFRNQPVDYAPPVQYKENYLEQVSTVDTYYPQYRVQEQTENIDIHVSVNKVEEVPRPVETTTPKEYFIETIVEHPREEIVTKRVTVNRRIEVPKLNKVYKDVNVEKIVEVRREVIVEQYNEIETNEVEDLDVQLKTVQDKVHVNKIEKRLPLMRTQRRGVLNQQQKRDFEGLSRQLAELQFESQKLEAQIEYSKRVDLGECSGDIEHYKHEAHSISTDISECKSHISELTRHRD